MFGKNKAPKMYGKHRADHHPKPGPVSDKTIERSPLLDTRLNGEPTANILSQGLAEPKVRVHNEALSGELRLPASEAATWSASANGEIPSRPEAGKDPARVDLALGDAAVSETVAWELHHTPLDSANTPTVVLPPLVGAGRR